MRINMTTIFKIQSDVSKIITFLNKSGLLKIREFDNVVHLWNMPDSGLCIKQLRQIRENVCFHSNLVTISVPKGLIVVHIGCEIVSSHNAYENEIYLPWFTSLLQEKQFSLIISFFETSGKQ